MMGPLVTDLFGGTVRNFAVDHGSQPLGALLLLGCLASQTWRRRYRPADQPAPAVDVPGHYSPDKEQGTF